MADATTATRSPGYGVESSLARGFRAVLRIGAALLFMQHGAQKLLGWFGGMDGDGLTAGLFSQMGLAGAIELLGGLLLLTGLFTRPVAVLAAVEMLAAYFIAHLPQGGFPVENQGELALLYMLIWAYIAAAGPGPASVDDAMSRRRTTPAGNRATTGTAAPTGPETTT